MDLSPATLSNFDFSISHLAYIAAGILIALSLMAMTWGAIVYVAAKRDETEWNESRPKFVGGSVTIAFVFLIWVVTLIF